MTTHLKLSALWAERLTMRKRSQIYFLILHVAPEHMEEITGEKFVTFYSRL